MVALGAYPFATPHTREPRLSTTSPSTDVVDSVAVPQELGRRARRHGGRARACLHRQGHPGARHLGAGAALRQRDELPGGDAGAAHRAARGRRDWSSTLPPSARRRIIQRQRLDQLVAGNDEHRAMVPQLEELYDSQQRPTCSAPPGSPPATNWPPSSNGSCATRTPDRRDQTDRRPRTVGAMKVDGGISFELAKAGGQRQGDRGRRIRRRVDAPRRATIRSSRCCWPPSTPNGSSSARRSPSPSPAIR